MATEALEKDEGISAKDTPSVEQLRMKDISKQLDQCQEYSNRQLDLSRMKIQQIPERVSFIFPIPVICKHLDIFFSISYFSIQSIYFSPQWIKHHS